MTRREFLRVATSAVIVPTMVPDQGFADPWLDAGMIGRVTMTQATMRMLTRDDFGGEAIARMRWEIAGVPIGIGSPCSVWMHSAVPGDTVDLVMSGLTVGTQYHCRVEFATDDAPEIVRTLPERAFVAQGSPGECYRVGLFADSHLGQGTAVPVGGARWQSMLAGFDRLRTQGCDFVVDLGDGPYPVVGSAAAALARYRLYRRTLIEAGLPPLYQVLGNHECEAGFYQAGSDDPSVRANPLWNGMPASYTRQAWAAAARLATIPNPSAATYPEGGGEMGNYYAWTWGDCLFVVLDPFRYTMPGSVLYPNSPAQYTLGAEQLVWLEQTLAESTARWKIVMSHNLVGGGLIGRDGAAIVAGGDTYAYARGSGIEAVRTSGEQAAIHQLMLEYGVQAYIYGHDHLFARSVVDGINYICCGKTSWLNDWLDKAGMLNSYGDLLVMEMPTWMRRLRHVLGVMTLDVSPDRLIYRWHRTAMSVGNNGLRDHRETWAGCEHAVSDEVALLTESADRCDGAYTRAGGQVGGYYLPPAGPDYCDHAAFAPGSPFVPLVDFVESDAVVDAVPQVVYKFQID